MKENGFTLIELLAVIVILAIIALIAAPIVINIISNTKEKAAIISVENYLKAVENAIAKEQMKNSTQNYDGKYTITNEGKNISSIDIGEIEIEYKGEGLKEGIIVIGDGKVKQSGLLKIDNLNIKVESGKINVLDNVEKSYLTTGQKFNSKIKTLVSGTNVDYATTDTTVTSIEFLTYGILPTGYTLEEFLELEKVDVSANSDETIYAIYDGNGKVYVYTEDEIVFNETSGNMFQSFISVETIEFGEYINTSKVTNMSGMFASCLNLSLLNLSSFDTSNVTNMYNMFLGCSNLISLNLNNFDTSNVTDMGGMFWECSRLAELKISNFDTRNVRNMWYMFNGCKTLTNLDVSSFDTSNVTNMNSMFLGTRNLKPIYVGEKWVIEETTDTDGMFTASKTTSEEELCEPNSTENWCVVTS